MDLISPVVRRWVQDARENPEAFWGRAAEQLPWLRTWDRVFEWTPPTFRWFIGGQTNLAYNALDHHVNNGWGGHTALVYLNERGERRLFTYAQLTHEVERVAAALRGLGIQKGDRITIYMPTCPEAIMLMLAAVRIGAIHVVVFAGFGAQALGDRAQASGSRFIFTADVTYRKGKNTRLKEIVDAALKTDSGSVERVIVLNRTDEPPSMQPERDITWQEFLGYAQGQQGDYVPMESNEPAFILATSGTTAKPKLAIHTHGGYQVHIHSMGQWVYGLKPTDVWWSTSDIGWVVGHSYIVYAPLIVGATTLAYEEVLNAPAWEWLQKIALDDRVPVLDHMWQTETGGPVFGNPYGLGMLPIKPGSATIALPGIETEVVSSVDGTAVGPNEKGIMVIKRPFPGLTPALWGEPERYGRDYWQILPGVYYTGDSAHIDEDGYVWFAGRADEIIKIAGHRIGTIEVETAFLKHHTVTETGVTARPDELRGEVISAFVVLKQGYEPSEELRKELLETVRSELGPVAVIGEIKFVNMLPKTRSGKIMRRVLRAVTLERDPGDISTIEDEGSVEEAREVWHQLRAEMTE